MFRPAGHGALLENLHALQGDIVYIKNIDNVVPDRLKAETYLYKKALGGYLVEVQNQVFAYLQELSTQKVSDKSVSADLCLCQGHFVDRPTSGLEEANTGAQNCLSQNHAA